MVGSAESPVSTKPCDSIPPRKAGWSVIFMALALVVMTLVAYWPAIHEGGFIWDDDDYVTENITLRDFSGLGRIWLEPTATPQYYPLVHTTFWTE